MLTHRSKSDSSLCKRRKKSSLNQPLDLVFFGRENADPGAIIIFIFPSSFNNHAVLIALLQLGVPHQLTPPPILFKVLC